MHTDIVRIELVNPNEDTERCGSKCPRHQGSEEREFTRVKIVHEHTIKLDDHRSSWRSTSIMHAYPDMTVHHQTNTEESIEDWVTGPRSDECGSGHGDERCCEKAFKRPVI